jgi:hypothetical protein
MGWTLYTWNPNPLTRKIDPKEQNPAPCPSSLTMAGRASSALPPYAAATRGRCSAATATQRGRRLPRNQAARKFLWRGRGRLQRLLPPRTTPALTGRSLRSRNQATREGRQSQWRGRPLEAASPSTNDAGHDEPAPTVCRWRSCRW